MYMLILEIIRRTCDGNCNNSERAKTVYPNQYNEIIKGRTKGVNIKITGYITC